MKVGDLVLLKKKDAPPGCWPLGIIEDVRPGPDGLVRVVELRTAEKREPIVYSARNLIVVPVAPDLVERAEYEKDVEDVVSGQDADADANEPVAHVNFERMEEETTGTKLYKTARVVLDELKKGLKTETTEEASTNVSRLTANIQDSLQSRMTTYTAGPWSARPIGDSPIPPPGMQFRKRPREWMRETKNSLTKQQKTDE